jgi:PAS domain-containing protein
VKQWELRDVTTGGRMPGVGAEALVEPLDPLRILVNQVPALFWTTDPDLIVTSSLGAEFERLGIGANQLVGTGLAELFETDGDHGLIQAHQRALAGVSVRFEGAWAGRVFSARVAPLRDSHDRVIGTICVALDGG